MCPIIPEYKELNSQQESQMWNTISSDKYDWEDNYLEKRLLGLLPSERHFFNDRNQQLSKSHQEQNRIVDEINQNIGRINRNLKENFNQYVRSVSNLYSKLYSYKDVKEDYSNEEVINEALKFNKVFLITGVGGIGKSEYMFELSQKINEYGFEVLTVYGKYIEQISSAVFNEIIKISEEKRFFLLVDAINELSDETRLQVLEFIDKNEGNMNLRIILTYRDYSLPKHEIDSIKSKVTDLEIFSGVSSEDAIEKISEKYNLDLTMHEHFIVNNNPYHYSLAIKVLSKNFLVNPDRKPLIKGTHLYEKMIQISLGKPRWSQTKKVIMEMISINSKVLTFTQLKEILGGEFSRYIIEMGQKNFIVTYSDKENQYILFKNESLCDYLIARSIMGKIKELTSDESVKLLKQLLINFHSVSRALIIMIFEKCENEINDALFIIMETGLIESLTLDMFNELELSAENMRIIKDRLTHNMTVKDLIREIGGYHSNPFNCVNHINMQLFEDANSVYSLEYQRYEVSSIRSRLKIWIRSIVRYEYSSIYIEEKFWFAFWISSLPNGNIRYLARKLIFEVAKLNSEYCDVLIDSYFRVEDDYIKEGIIHVLSSLEKDNKKIVEFFQQINNETLLNINCIQWIQLYLYGYKRLTNETKIDISEFRDKQNDDTIFDFLSVVGFDFKYDYRLLNMDVYNIDKYNIHFRTQFLSEDKVKINKIHQEVHKKMRLNDLDFLKRYVSNNKVKEYYSESGITEQLVDSYDIYLSWQYLFKYFLNKYHIDLHDIEKKRVFESDMKNNLYKALDLSISNLEGSLACNYYLNTFDKYNERELCFDSYENDVYNESVVLYYPISVYNEEIDSLDKKIIKKIYIPKIKTDEWAEDFKLSIANFRELIAPVKFKGEEWRLIYGSIKRREKDKKSGKLVWSDEYILNLAVDEKYTLSNNPSNDRMYTIETPTINDDVINISIYDTSRTCSLRSTNEFRNEFVETNFNVPSTRLVKIFDLKYSLHNNSWKNNSGEDVILVNNNKSYWYNDGITGSLFMKDKYFKVLEKKCKLKYFGFCERFYGDKGYNNESALQIELYLDGTENYYKHYERPNRDKPNLPNSKQNRQEGIDDNQMEEYYKKLNDLEYTNE
ncbi:hypothetical protein H9L01_03595 [Erysipelothrix inopinata]|uniref:Uncharacterized protein n=1 Tax=Erysipelothrix inopinata TaxID=225084 RepID=A0A7G9S0T3_9FIRM|nr:hypothetical protein [Erysipelothrix inopinata]QNN61458.1 hypothetical protein H9L01_03595 [Erysipelothrix inopinata]